MQPEPRRHVAQVVALRDEPVPGDQPEPVVLERPSGAGVCSDLAAVEQRRHLARQRGRVQRHLEVVTAQRLPDVGVRRDVVDPRLAAPRAERVERRELAGPRAAGQPDLRAVLEAVVRGSPRPARGRAPARSGRPDLRNRSRSTAGSSVECAPAVPREPLCGLERDRAAERVVALHEGHRVTELGQPRRRGQAADPPPITTTCHARRQTLAGVRRGRPSSAPKPAPYSRSRKSISADVEWRQPAAGAQLRAGSSLAKKPVGVSDHHAVHGPVSRARPRASAVGRPTSPGSRRPRPRERPSATATGMPSRCSSSSGTSDSTSATVRPGSTPASRFAWSSEAAAGRRRPRCSAPADCRVLISVGRNPSPVSTPSTPNAPR